VSHYDTLCPASLTGTFKSYFSLFSQNRQEAREKLAWGHKTGENAARNTKGEQVDENPLA